MMPSVTHAAKSLIAHTSLAAIMFSLLALTPAAVAQSRHDPLTEREIETLRDSAQDPKKRIDFLLGFVRERVLAVDRMRTFSKSGLENGGKLSQLLGDVASLVDELDDNLDMYNKHSEDLRRPLRHVLESEDDFLQKLKALSDAATPLQKRAFAAALEDASDSITSSAQSARAMLADQVAKKGEEKKTDEKNKEKHQQAESSGAVGSASPPR
jgi:hypothetical protein